MRRRCNERGAAAVELALVLPLLVMLVFGIIESGRYFYAKNTLTHAAREGARTIALGGSADEAIARVEETSSGLPVEVSFPDGETCTPPSSSGPGTPAKVRASVDFDFSIPFASVDIPDVESTAVMRCGG